VTTQAATIALGPRTYRRLASAAVGTIVLQWIWLTLRIGGDYATTVFTDLIGVPCAFAATAACLWVAAREESRTRRAWIALGAATASWGFGEVIWSFYEVVLRKETPFPGLADIGFIGLVPFAVVALLAFPTAPRGTPARLRAILDGLIIAGSVLFIAWAGFLGQAFASSEGSLMLQVVGLAYPIGDVVIIAIVLYVLARSGPRDRLALALVGAGLLSISFADAGFTWLTLNNLYDAGSLIDPLWNIGFLLIALGALRQPRFNDATRDERRVGPVAIAAPYLPFMLAIGVAMIVQVSRGGLEPFLFWDAILVILFLTVRQVLALVDNWSLNRDLERRVTERTSELQHALEELEQSKRLQDEFVANTSHELLTPLTIIMSSLDVIDMHDAVDEGTRSALGMAQGASARMKRLVENVLLASGVMSRVDCERRTFDVGAHVRDAIRAVDPAEKMLELHLQYPLDATGDAERFRMAVEHVLRNADKFAPTASTIRVEGYGSADQIHVVISDEGPGIPADQLDSVFRRFFQIDGSSTRRHGGLGLGLFLARHLVESMGGTLEADESSHGARLHLALPVSEAATRTRRSDGFGELPEPYEIRGVA
jgi:signal transduction histidine kinase